MSNLRFDKFQFAGRRNGLVHAYYTPDGWESNGIGYDDATRMQTQHKSQRSRWIPAFAYSDEKLRRVLLQKAWLYIHNKHSAPVSDWKTLNAAATKKALGVFNFKKCPAHKKLENQAHVASIKSAGGYLEFLTALAYRSWRLGQNSVIVAEALHTTPQAVRVNLKRLCNVARSLGFETFERHHSFQKPRGKGVRCSKRKATVRRAN